MIVTLLVLQEEDLQEMSGSYWRRAKAEIFQDELQWVVEALQSLHRLQEDLVEEGERWPFRRRGRGVQRGGELLHIAPYDEKVREVDELQEEEGRELGGGVVGRGGLVREGGELVNHSHDFPEIATCDRSEDFCG